MSEVVSQHNAEHYIWGGNCDGWHLLKSPGLSVIRERVPPGRCEVRHYHERAQQFFYVLAGEATLEVDGQLLTLRPHEGYAVPPQAPHQLSNEAAGDLEFLLVSAPASHGDRIELVKPLK